VIGGITEGWLLPFLSVDIASPHFGTALRSLRIFRVLRFLRLLKAFAHSDMAWSEKPAFQVFMSAVIGVNSIVMAIELDFEWGGWVYVENIFLVIYSFELCVSLKRCGCNFFCDRNNWFWNYLDLTMVVGGMTDLWVLPLVNLVTSITSGHRQDLSKHSKSVLNLIRMFRLLRVLRLVRLLRTIKPLYNLLVGVMESLKAMQWVMLLTLLTLYAGAITWTCLIGRDILPPPMKWNGTIATVDEELLNISHKHFGTVADSLFSLFKLMNGDTAPVASVSHTILGQLLFAGFMILTNWAVLAILTSVVSDNMISSSAKAAEEEKKERLELDRAARIARLSSVFAEMDSDGNRVVTEDEWHGLMQDNVLREDLCDITGLSAKNLQDMFDCVSHQQVEDDDDPTGASSQPGRVLAYDAFIDALEEESAVADKRSVRNVILHLHNMEDMMTRMYVGIAQIQDSLNVGNPQAGVSRMPSFHLPLLGHAGRLAGDSNSSRVNLGTGRKTLT